MTASDPTAHFVDFTVVDKLFNGEPVFANRAYMLDVSRDRVPRLETLDWLVGVLSRLRFTELQLYVEHTFAYRGHDEVWADASPFTADEFTWLDKRCALDGIELVANMNGFGHMGRWLRHDHYRNLAECPDGFAMFEGAPLTPPGCLIPNEANADFAVGLAREMLESVTSRRIHIGADEPFELGDGASASAVAERGRDRVYLEHLNRIVEPLLADGVEVMFWADLFRRDASLLGDLAPGAIPVVWNYEAPGPAGLIAGLPQPLLERLGLPDDAHLGFAAHARLFIEAGRPFWVAPGTSTWNTIIGRNTNAAANIDDAVRVGADHSASGFLLTDWGDGGHLHPLVVSLPSMVRAAVGAWTGRATSDLEVGPAIDALLGVEPSYRVGTTIEQLGHIGETLGLRAINASPIYTAVASSPFGRASGDLDLIALERASRIVEESTALLARAAEDNDTNGWGPRLLAELVAACGLARLALGRLRSEHVERTDESGKGIEGERMKSLQPSQSMTDVVKELRSAWLATSRSGGLDDAMRVVENPVK